MKTIMMSIKPKWVAKILNGEKTVEIRKRFPKEYVGWVYIYVTKDQNEELWWYDGTEDFRLYKKGIANERDIGWHLQNGKVVARFWCDKVEKIRSYLEPEQWYATIDLGGSGLLRKSCLDFEELDDYLLSADGRAIHITKLEIFDKPKEISEFYNRLAPNFEHLVKYCEKRGEKYTRDDYDRYCENAGYKLTRAPQSYCFIEI